MLPAQKSADLCWGQRYIWLRHHQLPAEHRGEAHIVCRFDLPDGATAAGLRSMLDDLVRRHEALRTTYSLGETGPVQRVHPPAALPLVEVTTERDGSPSPSEVIEQLSVTDFELSAEWPVRACAVTTGGLPASSPGPTSSSPSSACCSQQQHGRWPGGGSLPGPARAGLDGLRPAGPSPRRRGGRAARCRRSRGSDRRRPASRR